MIKSPPSTTSSSWISNSSSPSSTLSESSNCPSLTLISTRRKPRTPRKRPNQTYNEAAAILSTAYPRIFPIKHPSIKNKPSHFTKSLPENKNGSSIDPSDLLVPFQVTDDSGFLAHPQRSNFSVGSNGLNLNPFGKTCQSPGEIDSVLGTNISELVLDDECCCQEDFDAESIILDEEIGEGIDCIMGNFEDFNNCNNDINMMQMDYQFCNGYPVRVGFDEFGQYGMRKEMMRAIRNVDEGDWWRFPSVNVFDLNPKVGENVVDDNNNNSNNKKKKRKKKKVVGIKNLELKKENLGVEGGGSEEFVSRTNGGLFLKLNYDGVLNAWSDKGSPFSGECASAEVAGNDVQARLAQIELFSDNGGIREASVQRYKEKKRNCLFSKKIRYQVRKVNADRRPRIKGRFATIPNSSNDSRYRKTK